jgi:TPP-dependent pyruvate/acetoin dehydrogenase alpha subunit
MLTHLTRSPTLTRTWRSLGAPLARSAHTLFLGAQGDYTTSPGFYYPKRDQLPAVMPCYRIIDDDGVVVPGASVPEVFEESRELSVRMQTTMILVSEFDKVFNEAQRQGRLSFYFTNRGEEACSVGSGAALHDHDWVWPQYRELGATFWRGVSFDDAANQCCHNKFDPTKGRQLPMHIGSPERRLMYVKSNLGQQVPAATGAAYAMKLLAAGDPSQVPARTAGAWGHRRLEHRTGPIIMPHDTAPTVRPHAVGLSAHSPLRSPPPPLHPPPPPPPPPPSAPSLFSPPLAPSRTELECCAVQARCAITYFGEGCASEGDIPSALNIAAVHGCPTIFFCRNNGYAISTHTDDQYASDGVAPRGVAYGMPSIRVDGNDLLAVYSATASARRIAVEEGMPTMIEVRIACAGPRVPRTRKRPASDATGAPTAGDDLPRQRPLHFR